MVCGKCRQARKVADRPEADECQSIDQVAAHYGASKQRAALKAATAKRYAARVKASA